MPSAIHVRHALYGTGAFVRMLPDAGQCRVAFDIDGGIERRVLVRDLAPLTLRERAEQADRELADMMGRDPRAVARCLRESRS